MALLVKYSGFSKTDPYPSEIINLIKSEMKQVKINKGTWFVEVLEQKPEKTDKEKLGCVVIKFDDTPNKSAIFYRVALKTDSCYYVNVYVPPNMDIKDVEEKFYESGIYIFEPEPEIEKDSTIRNQIGTGIVRKHIDEQGKVGIEAEIEAGLGGYKKTYKSFIPLNDLMRQNNYDKNELNMWPVGKKFKAIVFNTDENTMECQCSTHTEGYSDNANLKDKFTGHKNADGVLPVEDYCYDHTRRYDLGLGVAAARANERDVPFSSKVLEEILFKFFDTKYGMGTPTKISHLALMGVGRGLWSGKNPYLIKTGKNFLVEDSTWDEYDANKKQAEYDAQFPPVEEPQIETTPVTMQEPELPVEEPPLEPTIINLLEFHSKKAHLIFIEEEIKRIEETLELRKLEKEEIDNFLKKNEHLNAELDKIVESATQPTSL